MTRTRILVADSVPIFRTGVRDLLAREGEFEIVEAFDLDGVRGVIEVRCPDIALIDLDLPPLGGVEACAQLAKECSAHMVVWSFEPTPEIVLEAIRAGASGYLHKEISPQGLVRSLRGAIRGQAPLSRDLASLMIHALHALEERATARERVSVLSAREREVLGLVAAGARNKEVARLLFISEFTVKRHMQNILQKLELRSRRAAATFYWSAYGVEPGQATAAVAETVA